MPCQTDRSAIRNLRKSQSLDFEPFEALDDSKADISNVSPRDFPAPPIHPIMGNIRPRSSSLKGPPRTVAIPLDSVSESTLSCTESEERLMESPSAEGLPRTEYITMTYDESQDTLQIAQRITNMQDVPKGKVPGNGGSYGYREPGYEGLSKSIMRFLPGNLSGKNYMNIVQEDDNGSIRHGPASISQLSSDGSMTYDYKDRGERVRNQKIMDLHDSRRQKTTLNDKNIKIVEDKTEEKLCPDSRNVDKVINAHHEPQVFSSVQNPIVDAAEFIKSCDNTSSHLASYPTDISPAMPKGKDLDTSQGVPDYKLIHPAYRTQLTKNKFLEEPAVISDLKTAGVIDANTTLPNSIYRGSAPRKNGSSSMLTSQVHTRGKDKPLPPIQHLRLKACAVADEIKNPESKKIEAAIIPVIEERKQSLDMSHQSTYPGTTAVALSLSSSSRPSQAATSFPVPSSSSFFSSSSSPSIIASPSLCQSSPPRLETLEHRVKQLEHEKLLLRTALTAVLKESGTLHSSS